MKPFKHIEESKKVINNLTYKLKYSKNKQKDAIDINTIIKTLKCFDSMLVSKYKTDALNRVIYALIYELLMFYKAYNKEIPLNTIIDTLENAFKYDSDYKKNECISILKHHELKNKIKNDSVFDENYANFDKLLTDLVNEFKQDMIWN